MLSTLPTLESPNVDFGDHALLSRMVPAQLPFPDSAAILASTVCRRVERCWLLVAPRTAGSPDLSPAGLRREQGIAEPGHRRART